MCNNYSMMFFCYLLLLNAMMIKFTENNSSHDLKMKPYGYLLISCMISNYLFIYFIYRELNLRNPIYQQTSTYGHFGRDGFTWEQPKKLIFD